MENHWATDLGRHLAVHLGQRWETQMALHSAEHWVQHWARSLAVHLGWHWEMHSVPNSEKHWVSRSA